MNLYWRHYDRRRRNNVISETAPVVTLSCGHVSYDNPAVIIPGTTRRLYRCPFGCRGFQRRRRR